MGSGNPIQQAQNVADKAIGSVNKAIESDRGRKVMGGVVSYATSAMGVQGALSRALGMGPPDIPPDPTAPIDDSTKTPDARRKRALDNRDGTILTGGGGTSGTLGDASGGKRSNLLGL